MKNKPNVFFFKSYFCYFSYIIRGKSAGNTEKSNIGAKRQTAEHSKITGEMREQAVTYIITSICQQHEYKLMNTEMMNKATCSQRKHDNTFPSLSQKENDCKIIKKKMYKLLGVVFNGILHSMTLFSPE